MKKVFTFLLALLLAITCCACASAPPAPADGAASSDYPYGNMQKNVPSGNFMEQEDSVLFLQNNILYAYNISTGTVSTFCKNASCDHRTKDCAAYGAGCNLEQAEGRLYAAGFSGAVLEWKGGHFREIVKAGVSHFWHAGGKLYAVTNDASLLVYDREGAAPQVVMEEYTGFWETVFGSYLYYSSGYNVCRMDLSAAEPQKEILIQNADHITDGKHIYYAPEGSFFLYRCDMDGKNQELLVDAPVLPASWNFDGEYFYFRLFPNRDLDSADGAFLYRFPKNDPSQRETIAQLPYPISAVYTVPGAGKLFVTLRNGDIYVMDRDGGNARLLALPDF